VPCLVGLGTWKKVSGRFCDKMGVGECKASGELLTRQVVDLGVA